MLPDEDSNLDKLNQNQLYCHYTIGQSLLQKECKNKGCTRMFQKNFTRSPATGHSKTTTAYRICIYNCIFFEKRTLTALVDYHDTLI